MKLFGFNINFSKAPRPTGQTNQQDWQLRPRDGQGIYTAYFANYIARKVEPSFYEFLREALPIMDAAINRLVSLDGHIVVTGDNTALVEEIKEWIYNVPVNDIQKGLQAFHQNWTGEALEQGFALGEYVANKQRNDIVGLRVADSKYINFKRSETGLNIYQKADNDPDWRELKQGPLLYFSINNENQNPFGVPLFRSCEFVAKVLATIHNSLLNVWERFGDPSYSIIYKTSRKDGTDLAARRQTIATEFNAAITAKREGKSADFVRAIDSNSEIEIKVIGSDGQVLELDVPARHVLEQIVAKSGLPAWMLGMHWSTTERLSDNEAEILLADVATRQAAKLPHFYNLIRTLLLLRGRTWKKGDWKLEWAQLNLKDVVKQAQARFLNAQADLMTSQAAGGKPTNVPGITAKSVKHMLPASRFPLHNGSKELTRPTPWPELDKVETAYENQLKADWAELKDRVFTILKLSNLTGQQSAKDAPPTGLEAFAFTEEQRAAIMQAMRDFTGAYNPDDLNSPILWYYGQGYSLGLIQAAKLIGKDRPILDIIKNKEIYDQLCADGFTLLKDDATRMITQDIMREIQAQMLAGTNPRHVATRLEEIFGAQNSDWERLARTEMSSAAERAKLHEWSEWKLKMVEFTPAPDACAVCLSLAGDYTIAKCPIPGYDTHPRCRCSTRPAKSEVTG